MDIRYIAPEEPEFIRKMKERAGIRDIRSQPNVKTRITGSNLWFHVKNLFCLQEDDEYQGDQPPDDSVNEPEDEKPTVVSTDKSISDDQASKLYEAIVDDSKTQDDPDVKPIFRKPTKQKPETTEVPKDGTGKRSATEAAGSSLSKKPASQSAAVKNTRLLSFQDDEEDDWSVLLMKKLNGV